MLEKGLHGTVLRLIIAPIYEQRRDIDLVQLVNDAPGLQRAHDVEFARSIPVSPVNLSYHEYLYNH